MGQKKSLQQMSIDELMDMAKHYEEMRQRRNARRRARRLWLKTAPRAETVLRYRAQESPCSVAVYLEAERLVLRWVDTSPGLPEDAVAVLLILAHNILHLLAPEKECLGTTLADCRSFTTHDLCATAIEIALNFNPDPLFHLTRPQIFTAMVELSQGVDQERLRFSALLGDISIDL